MVEYKEESTAFSRTKPPVRLRNKEQRPREFITPTELEKLTDAAGSVGRHGLRDSLMIAMAYRHALRAGELIRLKWSDIDFQEKTISINRIKGGVSGSHILNHYELKHLDELRKQSQASKFVFCSERMGALTSRAVHSVVARAGSLSGLELSIHPQMLCAGRGFQLASEGWTVKDIQAFLGHKSSRIAESYFRNLDEYLWFINKHPSFLDKSIPVVKFANLRDALPADSETEHSITVEVPASTCNLGPGLDTFGLALGLYTRLTFSMNEVSISDSPLVSVNGKMKSRSQLTEQSELVYAVLSKLWKYEPDKLKRLKLDITSDVPLGYGLGGSGTVVLGAVWAYHVLSGRLPSCKSLLKECRTLEALPEMTAASLLGGMTIYAESQEQDNNYVRHLDWPEDWRVIVAVPPYSLKTMDSRNLLPGSYPRQDVIHSIQRASLMVSAVYELDEELLKLAMVDRIHESYRQTLVPELSQIRELLTGEPIIGCTLAGGGSSVLVLVNSKNKDRVLDILKDWVLRQKNDIELLDLVVPKYGMREILGK